MQLSFTVHSVTEDAVPMMAMVGKNMVEVSAPGLVVELKANASTSCHTHRFIPDDMDAAKELFAPGEEIILTFSAA